MKKYIQVSLAAVIFGAMIVLGFFFSAQKKDDPAIDPPVAADKNIADPESAVRVTSPAASSEIDSPLEISGEARGSWYFEGSFPVRLEDAQGKTLARGTAMSQGDWTTQEFVPFKVTLSFDPKEATEGKIILEKDNPSDLPENANSFSVPIKFSQAKTLAVKVFFGKEKSDKEEECKKVSPRERTIPKTPVVARAALEQLLLGPTAEELAQGYTTAINPGVKVQVLSVQHGVAFADFNEQLEEGVDESCEAKAIRAQIEETLKQFSTIKEVIISINGRTEDVLKP